MKQEEDGDDSYSCHVDESFSRYIHVYPQSSIDCLILKHLKIICQSKGRPILRCGLWLFCGQISSANSRNVAQTHFISEDPADFSVHRIEVLATLAEADV